MDTIIIALVSLLFGYVFYPLFEPIFSEIRWFFTFTISIPRYFEQKRQKERMEYHYKQRRSNK